MKEWWNCSGGWGEDGKYQYTVPNYWSGAKLLFCAWGLSLHTLTHADALKAVGLLVWVRSTPAIKRLNLQDITCFKLYMNCMLAPNLEVCSIFKVPYFMYRIIFFLDYFSLTMANTYQTETENIALQMQPVLTQERFPWSRSAISLEMCVRLIQR